MRIGINPEKNKEIVSNAYHRILIPVYVPNLEGYFEQGMEFTKLCLESVTKTRHEGSFLTVVNNGSCEAITQYLQELYRAKKIDQLVHFSENVGKIDAVIPIARSCAEPLITISDGDVLFKEGWMQGVEAVFSSFPEAGMVSPVPHGTTYSNYTTNTIFDGFFKGRLKFQSICDPKEMLRFAESIGGGDSMYDKKIRLKYQLTVKRKDVSAVVGCGHFVSTLRREVFDFAPTTYSKMAYASTADRDYIDIPNEEAGFWRLATPENLAYHMGNTPQDWMVETFEKLQKGSGTTIQISKPKRWLVNFGLKQFVVKRLWLNRISRPIFFKWLGLKEGRSEY